MLRLVTIGLACGAWLCGCATTDSEGPAYHEKVYRTGSNIPKRDGSVPDGVETATPSTGDTRMGMPGVPTPRPGGRQKSNRKRWAGSHPEGLRASLM